MRAYACTRSSKTCMEQYRVHTSGWCMLSLLVCELARVQCVRVHWHGGPERGRPAWCVVANCSPLAVLQDCDAFPLVAIHQWYIEGVLSISSSFGPTIQLLPNRCCSRTLRVLSAQAHGSTRPPGDRTASSAFAGSSIVGGQGDEQPLTVSTRAEAPPVPHLCGN